VDAKSRKKILEAVQTWARRHPEKDKPVLQILAMGLQYTPAEFAAALVKQDHVGRFIWAMLENASAEHSADFIAKSFDQMFAASKPEPLKQAAAPSRRVARA
jgi:hypothetical protein